MAKSHPSMSTPARHFTKRVTESDTNDLTITGAYIELTLEKLLINQSVVEKYADAGLKSFTLAPFLYRNLWDYRISTFDNATDGKLIDSESMQHCCADVNALLMIDSGTLSENEQDQRYFAKPPSEIEGHAKARGWTWFPSLPPATWPARILLRFSIHDPGKVGGWVRDTETFEFVFSPTIFGRPNDAFVRLGLLDPRLLGDALADGDTQ